MIYLPKSRLTLSAPKLRMGSGPRLSQAPRLSSPATSESKSKSIRHVGRHWLSKPAVIYCGKREICNPATVEGRAEYKYRTLLMWLRQDGWCCFHEYDFCPGRLHLWQATFEHEGKRTRGQRDDRIVILDAEGRFVRHLNGAAHLECNSIVGSRKLTIWYGTNITIEADPGGLRIL